MGGEKQEREKEREGGGREGKRESYLTFSTSDLASLSICTSARHCLTAAALLFLDTLSMASQLDHTPLGNENILWLHITVDDLLVREERSGKS